MYPNKVILKIRINCLFGQSLGKTRPTDLEVPIGILSCSLEPANWTNLDGVGSRILSRLETKLLTMQSLPQSAKTG